MTHIAAAILAGGRGERLGGVNKALLVVDGTRLIDRILGALAHVDTVLLCAGGNDFPTDIAIPATARLADLDAPYAGPLAGLAAAVEALCSDPPDLLLTVAVDTPFFPADFIARALPLIESSEAVMGAYQGQDYPTNTLWRVSAVAELADSVRAGTAPHSLKRLAGSLRATRLDYTGTSAENPFANANTPAELEHLRARATARKPA
ncbi:MAG: NTP transferase domain-containing protein [Devosia sp.]